MTDVNSEQFVPAAFATFLTDVPPGQPRLLHDMFEQSSFKTKIDGEDRYEHHFAKPDLRMQCDHDLCGGIRTFRDVSSLDAVTSPLGKAYVNAFRYFRCWNCRRTEKTFAIRLLTFDGPSGRPCPTVALKLGEDPPFGERVPARVLKLFGRDAKLFLKGRQCENHGLGIAAFTYYRRVVENHKNEIYDQIIKLATQIGSTTKQIEALHAERANYQFARSVQFVKDALPQALLIRGHNPLTLLHSALSGSIHNKTDEQCLDLAHAARSILVEMTERLEAALKEDAEITDALTKLFKAREAEANAAALANQVGESAGEPNEK